MDFFNIIAVFCIGLFLIRKNDSELSTLYSSQETRPQFLINSISRKKYDRISLFFYWFKIIATISLWKQTIGDRKLVFDILLWAFLSVSAIANVIHSTIKWKLGFNFFIVFVRTTFILCLVLTLLFELIIPPSVIFEVYLNLVFFLICLIWESIETSKFIDDIEDEMDEEIEIETQNGEIEDKFL